MKRLGMLALLLAVACSGEGFESEDPHSDSGAADAAGSAGSSGDAGADEDGDGFAAPKDCDDTDPLVHPSVEGDPVNPQTKPRKDGSFDYDCDGTEEKAYPEVYDCANTPAWESGPIPECGQSAALWMGWSLGDASPCGSPHSLTVVAQACR